MDTYENPITEPQEEEIVEIEVSEPVEETVVEVVEPVTEEIVEVKPEPVQKKVGKGKRFLSILILVLIAVGSSLATAVVSNLYWQNQFDTMSAAVQERQDVMQEQLDKKTQSSSGAVLKPNAENTPAQVFEKVNPAVVEIACEVVVVDGGVRTEGISSGSGFVISADGYIVTNYHIIEEAKTTVVYTSDGKEHAARIIGADEGNDFALLKIEANDLTCVEFGSSDEIAIGEQVVAIGYPLTSGSPTLTVGYISAKNRIVTTEGRTISMLQTDAAINSGNSGGPLLNMQGQVIGITTAKSSGTSASGASIEGVGYAIPIDDIRGLIEDLKEYGYITGAYLGVWVRDISEDAKSYGLPDGVYVEDVMDGYCAQKAGVQAKDIIVDLGGHNITCMTDLTLALRKFKAGDAITMTVYRNGSLVYLNLTLDAKPQETAVEEEEEEVLSPEHDEYQKWFDYFAPFFGG